MHRFLPLVLLAAAVAGEPQRIECAKDDTLADLVEQAARKTGMFFVCDAADARIRKTKLGIPFSHPTPAAKLYDTYRAVLTFFEYTLLRDGDAPVAAVVPSRWAGEPAPRGRYRVRVFGLGGATVLELAHPAHQCWTAQGRRDALLPETRDRILATLRGVHAEGRRQAARLLGLFGPADELVRKALERATEDQSAPVRQAAGRALAVKAE